jgi:TolA-binding protein
MSRALLAVAVTVCLVALAGCEENDERLARFAEESTRQQAGQNREMAQLNREVSQTHQELVSLQHDLEEQQAKVNRQRDLLESERREIAKQRHRDPIIAAAISSVGVMLACMVPLALAGYLLYCLRNQKDDPVVTELLIEEMTSEQPTLLPRPQTSIALIEGQHEPEPPSLAPADDAQDAAPVD